MRSMGHRGPDGEGIWAKGAIGLGHTRLAVIDLSANGKQPMSNEDGTIWITYNGEIYNFPELRKELESKGYRFRSKTDTEVIVHLYEEEGLNCIRRLRGMFAFVIWDEKKRRLVLVRDRLGQKPLYYYMDREKILFSSEIKGILASGLVEVERDDEALYQYLCLGYVPHPKTGFKGIRKLPPAHCMVIREGNLQLGPYWSLYQIQPKGESVPEPEAGKRLVELLTEATRIRMTSDVPLGALLSGGIDSSVVVANMARTSGRVKTFTVGFEDKLFDERKEAKFLAERFGTEHHELVVSPNIADILPKLATDYGEPFGDPSAVPTYYIAQMARQHVTVVLNGDGGDESFAGYGEYLQGQLAGWTEHIPQVLGRFLAKLIDQPDPGKAKSLAQILALSGRPWASISSSLRLLAPAILIQDLLRPDFKASVGQFDPISHLVKSYHDLHRGDPVNTMLAVDRRTFLPDDLLFKIDIASMSHGLEARSPFLDHKLVEFAAGLPGWLKLNRFRKKYILRKSLGDFLPEEVLHRKKRGFDVPVGLWLRGELRGLVEEIISTKNLVTEILDPKGMREMFDHHLTGRKDWGKFFWSLLMLHAWSENVIKEKTIVK